MLKLLAMLFAFATTITYFDVDVPGGALTFVFLYFYLVIVAALISLLAAKLKIRSWARINSRGIETFAVIIFFSFINGLLLLIFAQITDSMHFKNLYEPFVAAASVVLIRQLFD